MILIDENIRREQWRLLQRLRIRARQIGFEIGRPGASDENIIPRLHQLSTVTFFTLDNDFFDPQLRHPNYCLIFLDVKPGETAHWVRRVLRQPSFRTRRDRMGSVASAGPVGFASGGGAHRTTSSSAGRADV
jgi:hypothetical protein